MNAHSQASSNLDRRRAVGDAAGAVGDAARDLAERLGLPVCAERRLAVLAQLLAADALAPLSARDRDPSRVLDRHVADSLSALELSCVHGACAIVDLGSGAGLPGLPIAIALPLARVLLVEASARKCGFIERAIAACGLDNAQAVAARAEDLARHEGRGRADLVTARAVAALDVTLEYAAPLLKLGGTLVVWRGGRDRAAERAGARAASLLGLEPAGILPVRPFADAESRHLHSFCKVGCTPAAYPRRMGLARKRPLGGDRLSDRAGR